MSTPKHILLFFTFFILVLNTNAQIAGNALNFDGSDDYVDCPLSPLFNSAPGSGFNWEVTIESWITPTLGAFQRLVFIQLDANDFMSISLTSNGEVVFYFYRNGVNYSVQSVETLNSLELAHVAATWDESTSESRIFLNGHEVTYASGLFVSSIGIDGKMTIGARTDGAQVFAGDIDELSIWTTAKEECEVRFEMNDKKSGTEPHLLTHYNFDQGIASGANTGVDELFDITSGGNDGTLNGFALSGNSSNWVFSSVDIFRWWGDQSSVLIGQLGLVSTINSDEYQWIYCSDLSPVPGATNVTFDPPTEDPNYTGVNDYYAVVSTTGNCVDTSGCFNVNGDALATNELALESLVSVYPNPSTGIFSIESSIHIESLKIHYVSGQLVESIIPNNPDTIQFDLSEKSGVYFVIINTDSGSLVKKILVQNL